MKISKINSVGYEQIKLRRIYTDQYLLQIRPCIRFEHPKNLNSSKPTQFGALSTHTDENCSIVLVFGLGSGENTPLTDFTLIFDTKADTADIRIN